MNDTVDYNELFPDNRRDGTTEMCQVQLVLLRMMKVIDHICRRHGIRYWMCSGTLLGAVRHKGFIPWDDDLDICMLREDYEHFIKVAVEEFPADMILQTREIDPTYTYLPLPCKVRDTKSLIMSPGFIDEASEKGLFIDIFPADRYRPGRFAHFVERSVKSYNMFICKGLEAVNYRELSFSKKVLALFHPVFKCLLKQYLRLAPKLIDRNRNLGQDCYIGHGFDTLWKRFFKYDEIYPLLDIPFEDTTFYAPHSPDVYLTTLFGKDYMTPPPEDKRRVKHAYTIKPIL